MALKQTVMLQILYISAKCFGLLLVIIGQVYSTRKRGNYVRMTPLLYRS
jgi:hypothetical protein